MNQPLTFYEIDHKAAHLHVEFPTPRWMLSSAVLNGGLVQASHILNLNVAKNLGGKLTSFEPSEITLEKYARISGWNGKVVGMMTAATMDSYRLAQRVEHEVEVTALVTVGVSNAKRAGEPAECREMVPAAADKGTINIIILTNANLSPAAMVEAVITVTEAKAAVLQDLGVSNPVTHRQATGTGTDSIVIANGFGPPQVRYCGKHMMFGEMLATTVIGAITSSLKDKRV